MTSHAARSALGKGILERTLGRRRASGGRVSSQGGHAERQGPARRPGKIDKISIERGRPILQHPDQLTRAYERFGQSSKRECDAQPVEAPARQARSASLTATRPSTEIRSVLPSRTNGHAKAALLGTDEVERSYGERVHRDRAALALCEVGWRANNGHFHRSVTRTAIYPQRHGPAGLSRRRNPLRKVDRRVAHVQLQLGLRGRLTRSGPIPARPSPSQPHGSSHKSADDPKDGAVLHPNSPTHRRSDRLPDEAGRTNAGRRLSPRRCASYGCSKRTPRRSSSCRIKWLSADGVTWSRDAAARKLRCSAIAMKAVRLARSERSILYNHVRGFFMVIGIGEASRCAPSMRSRPEPNVCPHCKIFKIAFAQLIRDSTPALGGGSTGAMYPLPALNQLDGRMQQPVGGPSRRSALRHAAR